MTSISINHVHFGHYRVGRGWQTGIVHAVVDGWTVTFTKKHGWRCKCGEVDCQHVATLGPMISADVLSAIRESRRHK